MKVSVGQSQDTFVAQADNFTVEGSEKTAELAMNQSRKLYATPVETLDQPTVNIHEIIEEKPTIKKQTTKRKTVKNEPKPEGFLP